MVLPPIQSVWIEQMVEHHASWQCDVLRFSDWNKSFVFFATSFDGDVQMMVMLITLFKYRIILQQDQVIEFSMEKWCKDSHEHTHTLWCESTCVQGFVKFYRNRHSSHAYCMISCQSVFGNPFGLANVKIDNVEWFFIFHSFIQFLCALVLVQLLCRIDSLRAFFHTLEREIHLCFSPLSARQWTTSEEKKEIHWLNIVALCEVLLNCFYANCYMKRTREKTCVFDRVRAHARISDKIRTAMS